MSKKKDIQDLLEENLHQQEFEIQAEWLDDLSAKLEDYNQEPKKKRGFFFVLFGLVCVGGIFAFFMSKNDSLFKNVNTKNQKQFQKNNIDETALLSQKGTQIDFSYIEEACYEKINTLVQKKNTNQNITSNTQNKNLEKNKTKAKTSLNFSQESLKTNKEKKSIKRNDEEKVKRSKKAPISESFISQNDVSTTEKENIAMTSEKESVEKNIETLSNLKEEIKDFIIENELITINKKGIPEIKSEEKLTIKNEKLTSEEEKIDSLKEKSILFKEPIKKLDSIDLKNDKKEPKTKNKLGLSLAINAGPSFLFRNFKSAIEKRNTEELNKIAWNASIEINKTFKNRIIVGTGISVANYGEM